MDKTKFLVRVPNIFSYVIEVDAQDKTDAIAQVEQIIKNEDKSREFQVFYENTLTPEYWGVVTIDKKNLDTQE